MVTIFGNILAAWGGLLGMAGILTFGHMIWQIRSQSRIPQKRLIAIRTRAISGTS